MSSWNASDFRGTMKLSGSIAFEVSLRARAVSHFVTSQPRFGMNAMPFCGVVDAYSESLKRKGFSGRIS